jgi:hypothetical protein
VPSFDDFVKSPTSALRFISLSLRRTARTPHSTRFARLEFGTFYKVVCQSTFYECISFGKKKPVTAFRAGNGLFIFGMRCLRHYQPLILIAANKADDKSESKDDNVDNGDLFVHKVHVGV